MRTLKNKTLPKWNLKNGIPEMFSFFSREDDKKKECGISRQDFALRKELHETDYKFNLNLL